jgi:tetratricopeptide (TPR) repeat protein
MEDELQEVRDNFYVGNYKKAMDLCEGFQASSDITQFECDATFARCCLSLMVQEKLKAMMNSESPGQRAAAFYHIIMRSPKEEQVQKAKEKLKEHIAEKQDMSSSLLYANILAMDGNYQDALNLTLAHPTLEMQALRVFIYLMCNQVGLAEKQEKEMAGANDDSAVYQMAAAAVHLASGNPEEAYLTYCDMSSKFPFKDGEDTGSVLLQTGKAVANMQRGMWQEALEDLQRANGMDEGKSNPELLVNLCCCMTHMAKKEEFDKYYAELERAAPNHPYVKKTQGIKDIFARFKASNAK